MNITISIDDYRFQQASHAANAMNKTLEQLICDYLGQFEGYKKMAEVQSLPEKRTFSQKWRGYFKDTCTDARSDYLKERYKL